jgi:hypothetical protein
LCKARNTRLYSLSLQVFITLGRPKAVIPPVGMTTGEEFVSGRVASWMDRIESGYSAATAVAPLRCARFMRTDPGTCAPIRAPVAGGPV